MNGERRVVPHYFMGAYAFSAAPPFEITHFSPAPLKTADFYEEDNHVIYPAGYVVEGPYIYLSYGRNDREIWIAKLDKAKLMASLVQLR